MTDFTDGRYYADGMTVHRAPRHEKTDGGVTIHIGFPLCTVDECVGEIGAKSIAASLNLHDRHETRETELLTANNAEVERRRCAERRVSELQQSFEYVSRLHFGSAPSRFGLFHKLEHQAGCGKDRERKMEFVAPGVFCDPCIAPLVAALNAGGFPTVASCCGHGHRPGRITMRSGLELLVFFDDADLPPVEALYRTDINGAQRQVSPAAPGGWRLLPEEPTQDMVLAAFNGQPDAINAGFAIAYRAMRDAAPPPPSHAGGG